MSFGRREVVLSVALVVLTAAVYSQVLDHDFVGWDDNAYVYENSYVRDGLTATGIHWALTASHSSNWHPLTWMSHMLDVEIAGVEEGVWLHHATSVLFHLANTVLLFVVLRMATTPPSQADLAQQVQPVKKKTGRKGKRPQRKPDKAPKGDDHQARDPSLLSDAVSFWAAAWVAAMFALHPLHVESVAWIAERKDVLSTFFGLLTIMAYIVYARRPFSWAAYLPVLVLFALGLMSKPMLVTWPLLLLLLDYWPLRRIATVAEDIRKVGWLRARVVVEKIPLVALALASSMVTFLVQRQGGSVRTWDEMPIGYRVANSLLSYGAYIRQTLWPVDLAFFYPIDIHQRKMLGLDVATVAVLLVAITGVVVWQWRRRPYLVVGWLWFLGTLVPVIGLVQVGGQMRADRYMYIPQIGLLLMTAWLLAGMATTNARRKVIATLAVMSVVTCSALTWRQVGTWRNNATLASHALAVTDGNALANYLMGVSLQKADQPDDAETYFREALLLNSRDAFAAHDLAILLFQRGELDEAFRYFEETVKRDPSFARGFAGLAAVEGQRGNLQQALTYARQAAELEPADFHLQMNLAIVLEKLGHWEEAAKQYDIALRIRVISETAKGELASGYLRLAAIEVHLNQLPAAEQALRKAIQIDPGQIEAINTLAWLLATQRDPSFRDGEEAVRMMEPLCQQLAAPSAALLDTLAATYAAVGRFEDAVATANRALRAAETTADKAMAKDIRQRLEQYARRNAIYEE